LSHEDLLEVLDVIQQLEFLVAEKRGNANIQSKACAYLACFGCLVKLMHCGYGDVADKGMPILQKHGVTAIALMEQFQKQTESHTAKDPASDS
jgi:hypothetical protein